MKTTQVAVDLAKSVFEVAVSERVGRVDRQLRLSRTGFDRFLRNQQPSEILMEACGTAHHWGRECYVAVPRGYPCVDEYVIYDIFWIVNDDKPLVWLGGDVKTPPFSAEARLEAGFLLRRLQSGEKLALPHSRPMPNIGRSCHELRIVDRDATQQLIYYIDLDAVAILEVFSKKRKATPRRVMDTCRTRLAKYKDIMRE